MTNQKLRHQITVSEMAPHVHSFAIGENKVEKLVRWLTSWIDFALECRKINPYDFMPTKADLAFHIGVSKGTMQNVFRELEDLGYLESKQRIGTYIKDRKSKKEIGKLTSKRELAVEIIKKYISENGFEKGDILTSSRNLAKILGLSNTTIRLAMVNLLGQGILCKQGKVFVIENLSFDINKIETKTLVEKVAEDIKIYIKEKFNTGDKLPPNSDLAVMFDVSIKTIHDAIKILSKEGVLYPRRGKYGTIVLGEFKNVAEDLYFYEKIEQKIKQYIRENCEIGNKLPTIKEFAIKYATSEKTVKKALDIMQDEGYITFSRGRHGGTFVTDIPEGSQDAYKWLAISNDYMQFN